MKTTIDLSDDLARSAKAYAARENMTLRSLIEFGLRLAMRTDPQRRSFRLRDASVTGRGLQVPYRDADWPRIRDAVYEGRGS
ncbi:MAG: DUF2191 domain-containing protein [Gammaproteobacteria bacterium]|nr:DUF2191 domain-containing protein [Gammaproteobacteria bacterium]MDE0364312.1 DUF2191 domain-containing protein [Gammaproteobacteria bacterium]